MEEEEEEEEETCCSYLRLMLSHSNANRGHPPFRSSTELLGASTTFYSVRLSHVETLSQGTHSNSTTSSAR
jgi:hypothetical protein